MDSGTWALIAVAALGAASTIAGAWLTRRTSAEKNQNHRRNTDTSEFEANIRAFDLRARNAEERAAAAELKADNLAKRVDDLELKDATRDQQLNRIRLIVQTWFRDLHAAWPETHPMPLPSADDLEVLGITIPKPKESS